MFKNIKPGWLIFVAFLLLFEVLELLYIDYRNDPIASIIFLHAFPIILILIILRWGPSKP